MLNKIKNASLRTKVISGVTVLALAVAGVLVSAPVSISSLISSAATGATVIVPADDYTSQGRISINKAITLQCKTKRQCKIQGATLSNGANIDGFYSVNNPSNDGAVVGSGNNIILDNLVTGSCMVGVKVSGSGSLVQGNEITTSRQCSGSSGPDADGIRYFGTGHVIQFNYIHDISFAGNPTAHIDCFQTWGGAKSNTIINNTCDNFYANVGSTEATQGANIENSAGDIFRNNYIHVYGKKLMVESSSSGTIIENNIFLGGPLLAPSGTPSQYGIFGSGSGEIANGNLFYDLHIVNGTSPLLGVSGSGNLVNTDPKMSGYCSLAYPDKGVLCGDAPTQVSQTATHTLTATPAPTKTITPTRTVTASKEPTLTGTITLTATIPPSRTATSTAVESPSKTATPAQAAVCAVISWDRGLNIRPGPSLFNSSLGYYLPGKYIPIENVITNGEGTWAQINRGQFFALKIGQRDYAYLTGCP